MHYASFERWTQKAKIDRLNKWVFMRIFDEAELYDRPCPRSQDKKSLPGVKWSEKHCERKSADDDCQGGKLKKKPQKSTKQISWS